MDVANKLTIISAFGRGQWLASERARHGQSVNLVDVSEALGSWGPEDWEGPFGFFKSDHLIPSQMERLSEDDTPEALNHGFTVWLKEGPVEFRGPLTAHRLEAMSIQDEVCQYLHQAGRANPGTLDQLRRGLKTLPFTEAWPAFLSHQLASTRYLSPRSSLNQGQPQALFSQFYIRQATRPGYQRSLLGAEHAGVNVFAGAKLVDVAYDNEKQIRAIEIKSHKHSGVLRNQEVIWMLSTLETQSLGQGLYDKLFAVKPVQPQWSWMRYQFDLAPSPERDIIPIHFVFVESLELPWTHDNLAIVERTFEAGTFNVWMRIPYAHRFEKSYLEKMALGFSGKLAERLPQSEPKVRAYPSEYEHSFEQLGAPRFPVYALGGVRVESLAKNLRLDGPEHWPGLDWGSQLAVHREHSRALELKRQESLRKDAEF